MLRTCSLLLAALGCSFLACSSETSDAGPSSTSAAGASGAAGSGAGPAAGAAGASNTAGSAGSGTSGGLPCEVQSLLASRCQQCHGKPTQFGAPMPLMTRDDLLAKVPSDPATTAGARALARMLDDVKPMPQPPNPRASEAEIAAFKAWLDAGMPASSEACGSGGAGSGGSAGAGGAGPTPKCVPDVIVKASSPWTIKQTDADRYVCFGGKIAASSKPRHITEVSVQIDNTTHAHHLCIYDLGSNPVPTEPEVCSPGNAITKGKLLYCWAPGADASTLPPEAGFPIPAGKDINIFVEMHYSNIQGAPDSTDNSAATFCTTEQLRTYDADVMAFGSIEFSLPPAQSTTVESTLTVQPGLLQEGWARVVRGWPHMHLLGVAQSTTVLRDGAPVADLGSTNTYSFENQIGYPIDVTVKPGDKIVTKCMYKNTTTDTVSFGENTESEMCYNFVTYYPRITNPNWVWAAPSYLGKTKTYPTP